jgi:heptosyltransferase-2
MKIIVRGANWIGDAVMSIPALRALRRTFPEANITLYTKAWAEGIFQDADFIDRILRVEAEGFGIRDVIRESKRVKQGSYDLAILFTNSFQTAAVARLAGVNQRVGYSREGRGILLSDPIRPPPWQNEKHQSSYYLNLIEELCKREGRAFLTESMDIEGLVTISPERRERAWSKLIDAGVDPSKPTIGLGVGSTNSAAKRWGSERYAELSDLIVDRIDANIVLLGSTVETDIASQVAALAKSDMIDLTGTTDLSTATAILSEIDLFVSNDMGLAHISAAVGTKTLVIFGPTNDITTRPLGSNASVIRHQVECSPCMLRECPIDHRCMTRVEAEVVFQRAVELINE